MTLPFLRRLHKWVAIVVGLQLLLWSIGGATFAWLDHHEVAGEHVVREPARPSLPDGFVPADPRTSIAGADVREVRLQALADRWVYRVARTAGVTLHDAADGRRIHVDEPTVRALASARYAGEGRVIDVKPHPAGTLETRDHGAAWAVRYDDADATTLWFAADDGRLLEARTDAWRLFDLLWMLHTMDYRGRDDFNNPLVVLFASGALWVTLTGVLLLIRVFGPRRGPAAGE